MAYASLLNQSFSVTRPSAIIIASAVPGMTAVIAHQPAEEVRFRVTTEPIVTGSVYIEGISAGSTLSEAIAFGTVKQRLSTHLYTALIAVTTSGFTTQHLLVEAVSAQGMPVLQHVLIAQTISGRLTRPKTSGTMTEPGRQETDSNSFHHAVGTGVTLQRADLITDLETLLVYQIDEVPRPIRGYASLHHYEMRVINAILTP
jgi:hypothetical protein